MAAAQPLNSEISVFYRVRAQRDIPLHRSCWEVGNGAGVHPLVLSKPGEEVLVTATRDAATNIVTTTLSTSRDGGYAVVRYVNTPTSLDTAMNTLTGIKIVRIGKDAVIEKNSANVTDDLFGEVAAL